MVSITELTKLWESKFDHIYLRWYVNYKDRYNNIINELNRIGILQARNFSIFISINNEFDNYTYESLYKNEKIIETLDKGLFYSANAFYRLLNEIDQMEYKNVLVIEDDAKFINDLEIIKKYLEQYDSNIDCCFFDYLNCAELDLNSIINDNNKYCDNFYYSFGSFWASTCIAYNYNFIKFLIKCHSYKLGGPDYYYNYGFANNSYVQNVFKHVNDNCGNYKIVFTYPRMAIQQLYENNVVSKIFNITENQYESHFVNTLNKDINYSQYL